MKVLFLCCFLTANVWARSDPKAICRQGPFVQGSVQRAWMYDVDNDQCVEFLYSDQEDLSESAFESYESCVSATEFCSEHPVAEVVARDDITDDSDNEDCAQCNWLNWSHYRYMKCTPNFEKRECCPSSFTCPELPHQSKSECFYDGKTYQQGDEIPDVFKKHPCSRDCRCVYGHINCANVECPSLFNPEPPKPGCVDTYEKYDCCPSETKCNIRESDYICEHEGKRYVQGQKIEIQSERSTEVCICESGFSGAGSPSCREIDCGYDLRYRKRLSEGCVPVFYSVNSSCPIEWMCPGSDGHAGPIPEDAPENAASDKQCRFGEDTLQISQTWISEDPCLNCECQTPPMLSCLREQCPSPDPNCKYLGKVEGQCCHKYDCPDE